MGRQKRAKRRANGDGTLILRGGYYYAVWFVNGKKCVRTTKCSDKREAEKVLAEFVRPTQAKSDIEKLEAIKAKIENIKNGNVAVGKDKPIKIGFMLAPYIDDLSRTSPLADATLELYQKVIDQIEEYANKIGKEYIYELDKDDVEDFFVKLSKKSAPTTYNCVLKVAKSLIKTVMKHDNNIKANFFADIPYKKVDKSRGRRELSEAEINKLIECASTYGDEIKIWFMIGAYTGLRRQDAASLKWSEIDMEAKMIRKLPSKTKKNGQMAHIPICKTLYELFSSLEKTDEYLTPHINQYDSTHKSYIIRAVFKKAKIDIISKDSNGKRYVETGFHSFRHSLASRLTREGMPVPQLQMILAHSTADMSLHYSHANEADLVLPDFDSENVTVKVKKTLVEELKRRNVTIEDVIHDWLNGNIRDIKAEIEEAKKAEEKELDDMIDEIFSEKSTTVIDSEKQK